MCLIASVLDNRCNNLFRLVTAITQNVRFKTICGRARAALRSLLIDVSPRFDSPLNHMANPYVPNRSEEASVAFAWKKPLFSR
jgi:hypothetical protein